MSDFLDKLTALSTTVLPDSPAKTTVAPLVLPSIDFIPAEKTVNPVPVPDIADPGVSLATPLTPEQRYTQNLEQINAGLKNPTTMALLNLSRQRGNGLTANNQILEDRKNLSASKFILKHGDDVYQKVLALEMGEGHLADLATADRSAVDWAKDIPTLAGSGLLQGIGGIATFAAGSISDKAGVSMAQTMGKVKEITDGFLTKPAQRRQFVDGLRTELDNADNARLFEQEKQTEGKAVASFRNIGRDVLAGAGRWKEDPTMAANAIVEALGSMAAGGVAAKGVTSAANAVSSQMFARNAAKIAGGEFGIGAGARAAQVSLDRAAFPLTIGAMEAGGSYAQTVQEVMALKHEDLLKTSTAYKAMIDNNISPRDAKITLAGEAGSVASALTFPVGALTGKMVAGIEKAPLSKMFGKSPGEAINNISKEFLEEGIQSATGQLAGNTGQALLVNPEKNLVEGVGSQMIQGAIAGAGSAGMTAAPRGMGAGLNAGLDAVLNRVEASADKIREDFKKGSGVTTSDIKTEIEAIKQDLPAVAEAVRTATQDPLIPSAEKKSLNAISDRIQTAFEISPEEVSTLNPLIVKSAQELFPDKTLDRFDLMTVAAATAANAETSQEDRTDAALWLHAQQQHNRDFIREGKEILGKLPHDRPEVKSFDQFSRVLDAMFQTSEMAQTMEWVREKLVAPKVDQTTDLTSPEGQKAIQTTIAIAELVPEKLDPVSANVILKQDKLVPTLNPKQRRQLHSAVALAEATTVYAETAKIPPNTENQIKLVNKQIASSGGKAGYQKSLKQHSQDINAAFATGDDKTIRRAIQHLVMFGKSMRNKHAAMQQAILNNDGKNVPFQALGPNNTWLPLDGKNRVFYHSGDPKSETLARAIKAEAAAVISLANSFVTEYQSKNIKQIVLPEDVNSSDIIRDNSSSDLSTISGRKSTATQSVKTKSQVTTSKTGTDERQLELFLPSSRTASEPDAVQAPAEVSAVPINPSVDSRFPVNETVVPETGATESSAIVEPVAQTPKVVDQGEPQTIEAKFPNLVRMGGQNYFHRAYLLAKQQVSRLLDMNFDPEGEGHPLRGMYRLLSSSSTKLRDLTGLDPNSTQLQAYNELLLLADDAADSMNKRLSEQTRLLDLLKKDDDTRPVLRFDNGKVLNIVEKTENGFAYNPQLQEAALLAGIDWLINSPNSQGNLDPDELGASLGVTDVSPNMVDFFNRGLSYDHALTALSSRILAFWGLKVNRKEDIAYTKGIVQAVAIEILTAFTDVKLVETENSTRFLDQTGKTYGRVYFDTRADEIQALFNDTAGARNLISKAALLEDTRTSVSIGSPIKAGANTQLRNPAVRNTRQQRKALANEQQVKYLPNLVMYDFMEAVGENNFVVLNGGLLSTKGLNVNHALSMDGVVRGLRDAFRNVRLQMTEVKLYAESNNPLIKIEEVASYYPHEITRAGRMQMMGPVTPQGNKYAREVFMPTKSILNMTTDKHQDFFWLTVAQGLGEKTERLLRSVSREQAEALVAGKYADVLGDLRNWLTARSQSTNGSIPALPKDIISKLLTAAGTDGISMHGVHSLLAVAQLQLARESGADLTAHPMFNYLEADGKTNGPINALMLMASHNFNALWLKNVGKGGVFFGPRHKGKTLNKHAGPDGEDQSDLYQTGADQHRVEMHHLQVIFSANPKLTKQMQAMFRLISALDMNIKFDGNEIQISRKTIKNPMTITVYGSGVPGIASKVTHEILESLYEKMSEFNLAQKAGSQSVFTDLTYSGFWADLNALFENKAIFNKNADEYQLWKAEPPRRAISQTALNKARTAEGFTVFPHQFESLKTNIQTMFVEPMVKAIDGTVMNHVRYMTKAIQQATQIQSVIMQAVFRRRMIKKLLDRQLNDKAYRTGDFLSEEDLTEILAESLPYGATLQTGTQSYLFGGAERQDVLGVKEGIEDEGRKALVITKNGVDYKVAIPQFFARGLEGNLSTSPLIYSPGLARVQAVPITVIGSGDGQMMLNAAVDEFITGVLKVFDGMNMPADRIEDYSESINKAVYQTWMTKNHPVRAMEKSFRSFVALNPLDLVMDRNDSLNMESGIYDNVRLEMTKVLTGNPEPQSNDILTLEEIRRSVDRLLVRLTKGALRMDVRQQVIREFGITVDQMASGETPFVQEGTTELPADITDEDLLKRMEKRFTEIMDGIVETSDKVLTVTSSKGLMSVVDQFPDKEGDYKRLLTVALKVLQKTNYRLVQGSVADVANWLKQHHAGRYQAEMLNGASGFVDPVARLIVVANSDPETMLHEILHAATFHKVSSFYADPKSVPDVEQFAIENIEGLMGEWLRQDFTQESETSQIPRRIAENAVRQHLLKGEKAAAVNEFMAWVLSNQELAKVAKKTSVIQSIFKIVGATLAEIKTLLWGKNKAPTVGDDMLSQLRFNTRILMATPTRIDTLIQDSAQVALFQSKAFGTNERLSRLRNRFQEKIISWQTEDPAKIMSRDSLVQAVAYPNASRMALIFQAQGFVPTVQESSTFQVILAALAVDTELNANAMSEIQEIYDEVIEVLEVENFMTGIGDPGADRAQAQDKFNVLHGVHGTTIDSKGRSSLMPAFLALSLVDENFRNILVNLKMTKTNPKKPGSLDERLDALGNASMDRLSNLLIGDTRKDANVRASLDRLTEVLIEVTGDTRTFIEQRYGDMFEYAEDVTANKIQELSEKASDKADKIVRDPKTTNLTKASARLVRFLASIINERKAEAMSIGIMQELSKLEGAETLRAFAMDVFGRTKDNASIVDMVKKVRSLVQQVRQQFRENLPRILAKQFTRKLTPNEWGAMFYGIGKVDLAALYDTLGLAGSIELLADLTQVTPKIATLEAAIRAADPKRAARLFSKSEQLARFMRTGEPGLRLLRNAFAVAHLPEEKGFAVGTAPQALISQLDQLITLYALRDLDQGTKDTLTDLAQNQKQGIGYSLAYIAGLRKGEMNKSKDLRVRFNAYKGHIANMNEEGASLIVAEDSRHAELTMLGYEKVAAYFGSSADQSVRRRSYYFAPLSGRAAYNQGVMQTVHMTAGGVDPETGYTVGEIIAGNITDPKIVQMINLQLDNQRVTTEQLLPVFGSNGKVLAFERSLDPVHLGRLNRETNFATLMGIWEGRQVEEKLAVASNHQLIINLHEIWTDGKANNRQNQFVDLANLESDADPILKEAWRLVPRHTREQIEQVFGKEGFPVRRDLLNDTMGYRLASVGDAFTGESRWSPTVQKRMQDIALGIFGGNAYQRAVRAEKIVQEIVVNAKVMIVIKSVVVPVGNLLSNIRQLLMRGVPVRHVIKGLGAKTIELNDYIKHRAQELEFEADLQAAKGVNDLTAIRKLETRLTTLRDSYKRLTIWPLIEAGEFSSISNGIVTEEDLALANKRWGDWAENLTSKIPEGLKTPWRYAFITRDTSLFLGLAKAVQYGDFLGKAILYDDLVDRKGMNKKDALAQVSSAFVNYDLSSGRTRQALENLGLLWFYNFKLRSIKEAAYIMRHNPLRALMSMMVPTTLPLVGKVGSPMSDNLFGLMMDGKTSYSIGPGMGINSMALQPWFNLVK